MMFDFKKRVFLFIVLLSPLPLLAESSCSLCKRKSCTVAESALDNITVSISSGATARLISAACCESIPGKVREGTTVRFTSYRSILRRVRAKKLSRKRINRLRREMNAVSSACDTVRQSVFTPDGTVTTAGKKTLGIPLDLPAHIAQGRQTFDMYCNGCHVEQQNRVFPSLRSSIEQAPMFYDVTALPDADLAHLTAYLNRNRTVALSVKENK